MKRLDRRQFTQLTLGALAVTAAPLSGWSAESAGSKVSSAAARLYKRAIVIDGCGGPGGFVPDADDSAPLTAAMIADAKNSGITAVNMTVSAITPDHPIPAGPRGLARRIRHPRRSSAGTARSAPRAA